MPSDPEEEMDLELVMPFTVCESNGGPYEDEAFVAGYTAGTIDTVLQSLERIHAHVSWWVPPKLVPQLDLLAMRYGFEMTVEPWEGHEEETTFVTFGPPMPEEDDE